MDGKLPIAIQQNPVNITYSLINKDNSPITFNTLNLGFTILDSYNRNVWNLDVNHQLKEAITINRGQSSNYTLAWPMTIRPDGDFSQPSIEAPPGKYTVKAFLTTEKFHISNETLIVIERN